VTRHGPGDWPGLANLTVRPTRSALGEEEGRKRRRPPTRERRAARLKSPPSDNWGGPFAPQRHRHLVPGASREIGRTKGRALVPPSVRRRRASVMPLVESSSPRIATKFFLANERSRYPCVQRRDAKCFNDVTISFILHTFVYKLCISK